MNYSVHNCVSIRNELGLGKSVRKVRIIPGPFNLLPTPIPHAPEAQTVCFSSGKIHILTRSKVVSWGNCHSGIWGKSEEEVKDASKWCKSLISSERNTSHWTVSHPQENVPPRWSPESCCDLQRERWFLFSLYSQLFPWGKTWLLLLIVLRTSKSLSGNVARLVG